MAEETEKAENKDKRAVISEEIAVEIFAKRKMNTKFKTADSCLVANEYGVSSKSVRDVWDRRTWVKATMPLWTPAEVEQYEKSNKRPPGRPLGVTDSKPRKRRCHSHKSDQTLRKKVAESRRQQPNDASSSSSSSSSTCYFNSSSCSSSSSEAGSSTVDNQHAALGLPIEEAKSRILAAQPFVHQRPDAQIVGLEALRNLQPPTGIEMLLAGNQAWNPPLLQSQPFLLLQPATSRPILPLQTHTILPSSTLNTGIPFDQPALWPGIVNIGIAQRISATNTLLMLNQACISSTQNKPESQLKDGGR
ncbi:hypothetical protein GUITHDRAFT_109903 [Guillardia theta CCMP2712]|uniref:Uncharacterized protein n=1 Tax=Guillardia theta (strain CCMP2712) TaxID=905079 RepID=L1J7R1_GUITC|nr:hypothetical protein GUITHDRAFT_109903 [Guillardia theta CCMP2712]EKX44120.1 hypothetical protein GUITHDRAFT_109903 [Guillardia theta CCMP2712]|eukprot:XP_005831100.1 hypothetical protein GUITHDRAFT_109903 [Guillardia theta CCMP2712]